MGETGIRENEQITDALMISLTVIVRDELSNGCPQRVLAAHGYQVVFLDRWRAITQRMRDKARRRFSSWTGH